MTDELSPIDQVIIGSGQADCTNGGWFWYCDAHDTHGNADTEDEARAISAAHTAYKVSAAVAELLADPEYDPEIDGPADVTNPDFDQCYVVVYEPSSHRAPASV